MISELPATANETMIDEAGWRWVEFIKPHFRFKEGVRYRLAEGTANYVANRLGVARFCGETKRGPGRPKKEQTP